MPNRARILICEDEELVRWSLSEGLRSQGYTVIEAEDGAQCLAQYEAENPDLVMLDIRMPEMTGLECLRRIREAGSHTPVIMLTAMSDVESAVEATRLGASRYLTKPFELETIFDAVDEVLEHAKLRTSIDESDDDTRFHDLIGTSASMQRVFGTLRKLMNIPAPTVLITGESGTGKDVVARTIHKTGSRSGGPFVEVDCTAIPEQLMESTLFGHERGAFTDAKAMKKGLFEIASGGVVFLDEIGELPASMQAKLLRALENRRFKRVVGSHDLAFDAAIIAATNRDLKAEVQNGNFREDLYYRLAVVQLSLPPLRTRLDDIPLLVRHFVDRFNSEFGRNIDAVTADAMEQLKKYSWPGNIRELRNTVECSVIFHEGETLGADDLPPAVRYATSTSNSEFPFVLPDEGVVIEDVERGFVVQALDRTDHNYAAAARLLGLSRYALRTRVKKYGLARD